MASNKFDLGEAIIFDPPMWRVEDYPAHPLKRGEVVYFISEIPNVEGHCLVAKYDGKVVPMVHPGDFRKATDDEL